VLRGVAAGIRELIRNPNYIGRLDGGEFLIVFPNCTITTAVKHAEIIYEKIRANSIVSGQLNIRTTISVGIVQFKKGQEDLEGVLLRADQALNIAKRNGRDRWATLED
jgi:diguanylate cyclase (GGDEF)-like protein